VTASVDRVVVSLARDFVASRDASARARFYRITARVPMNFGKFSHSQRMNFICDQDSVTGLFATI